MPSPAERMRKLVDELNEHDYRYRILAAPTISDQAFDEMMKELESVEAEHPDLVIPDSPSLRVGSDLTKSFDTIIGAHFKEYLICSWYDKVADPMWARVLRPL